jgi:putative methyltransferase
MNFYNKVGNALRDIDKNKISFKSAIYNYTSYEGDRNFKKVYKLVVEVLKCKNILNEIIEKFFQFEEINNLEVFMVLCYEKFFSNFGSRKKIGGKLMRMLKEKEQQIKNYVEANYKPSNSDSRNEDGLIYFRINEQVNDNKFKKFLNEITSSQNTIQADSLITGLYTVPKSDNQIVKTIFEYKNTSQIIMQSKSSCLPAYILKLIQQQMNVKNEICDVIDTCSAPGNKTLQLSEYFSKNSKIFAFEIDTKRFQILSKNIESNNFNKNVYLLNEDFLLSDPNDSNYTNVKYILSDPSCSGSGTLNNNLVDQTNSEENSFDSGICCLDIAGSSFEKQKIDRLTKLANFQIRILEHCMKFPSVEFISYSTCSIFMTENEYVVNKVLDRNKSFRLFDIFKLTEFSKENNPYDNFHKGLTPETELTLRCCRICHKIDGFYVAIFQRIK